MSRSVLPPGSHLSRISRAGRLTAAIITVAAVTAGCVVPAPEPPSDAVSGFALPLPGHASAVPAEPAPPEVQMCPTSLLPMALPAPRQMPFGSTMATIVSRGKLVVGLDIGSNLLSFREPITGVINGFDVGIAREIATAMLGSPDAITFRILGDDQRISALQDGSVDLVVKTMSATCDRAQQVAFSATYFIAQQRILSPRGSNINTVTDLSGRRVCAVRGTTSMQRLRRQIPSANLIAVDSWSDCLVMLQQSQADALSTDDAVLAGLAAQDPNLTITGPSMGADYYAVGINKNNTDLVRFVNAVLFQMSQDGSWMRLYQQWFGDTLGPVWSAPAAQYRD
jgi:polar amino acid transport system substrate-binding protein